MTPEDRLLAFGSIIAIALAAYNLLGGTNSRPLVTVAFLARYSVLIGACQCALGLLAIAEFPIGSTAQSLLQNVFILDDPAQLCHVTWMSLLLGTAVIVTFRTTRLNGHLRFGDFREAYDKYAHAERHDTRESRLGRRMRCSILNPQTAETSGWRWRWLLMLALSLPIPLGAWWLTTCDMHDAGQDPSDLLWLGNLLLGVGFWALIMAGTTFAQQLFLPKDVMDLGLFPFDRLRLFPDHRRLTWLDGADAWLAHKLSRLGPGFGHKENDQWLLCPGHAQLATYTTILLAFYVGSLFWSTPPAANGSYSTLFGLLTMLLLVSLLSTGAAFLLDYFRIPLVLSVVGISLVGWTVSGADSFYDFATDAYPQPPTVLSEVFPGKREKPPRTIVVVTAAGGGIQAAAWTARVLTGLHELCGNEFTGSIGIVSAVSGGSVGAMFYLDRWNPQIPGIADDVTTLEGIRQEAMNSSLEATAWGWSRWDTVKTVVPYFVPTMRDRGWAIEESWRRSLLHPHATMAGWGQSAREGKFPVVIFNATSVDDGKRFTIANLSRPQSPGLLGLARNDDLRADFERRYGTAQINVATAARLSATFPYVTPICRPAKDRGDARHLADGGYVDNEGLVSALDWLDHFLADQQSGSHEQPFDQVLLVRILPFPEVQETDPSDSLGWPYALLGPIETLANVQQASQVERNAVDLKLVGRATTGPNLTFRVATFRFHNDRHPNAVPPLSWKLSRTEKSAIESAWQDIVNDWRTMQSPGNPLSRIDPWFAIRSDQGNRE